MNRLKLEALASSILIYLIVIVSIFSIVIYSPTKEKSKNYVEKKSDVIEVSLGSPVKKSATKSSKTKTAKKSTKKSKKRKKVPKKVRNITKKSSKKVTKKPSKKRVKTKPKKSTKSSSKSHSKKPSKASSLFKNLPSNIKDDAPTKQSSGSAGKSNKKVNKGRGVVNKYFAKIQSTLKGWPAQSNFAGEKVKVELTIYSSGLFDYKVLSRSLNPEFNRSLKGYLEQLKKFGFGAHSNPKPYKIIVEFIAKG
jgi:outer membrane biosynthesis protein TonB